MLLVDEVHNVARKLVLVACIPGRGMIVMKVTFLNPSAESQYRTSLLIGVASSACFC